MIKGFWSKSERRLATLEAAVVELDRQIAADKDISCSKLSPVTDWSCVGAYLQNVTVEWHASS